MTNSDITNILYCRLDGLTTLEREQVRYQALHKLGLINSHDSVAILEEATQSSSNFLETPIALLSIFVNSQQLIKSVMGLNNLGFNQELVVKKQIPPSESFCIHVVDSLTALAIDNTLKDPFFCQSLLTQHCGVRSYLGVPLITTTGECIGTLAVMDLQPRKFATKDLQFLGILARLTMTQLENQGVNLSTPFLQQLNPRSSLQQNNQLCQLPQLDQIDQSTQIDRLTSGVTETTQSAITEATRNLVADTSQSMLTETAPNAVPETTRSTELKAPVKLKLLAKLIEELRTPLTAVMGMTGILQQQIYGLLTLKQQEYLEVIHQSGQRMLTRIEEILALDILDIDSTNSQQVNLTMVDVEMLCQQVINTLQGVTQDRKQKIYLEIQEGSRLWVLDRLKVRQMLYYLVAVMVETLPINSQIKIIVDQQDDYLCIQIISTQVGRRLAETNPRSTGYNHKSLVQNFATPSNHPSGNAANSSNNFGKYAGASGSIVLNPSARDPLSNSFLDLASNSAPNSGKNSPSESALVNKFQLTVGGVIGDGVVNIGTGGIEGKEQRYSKASMTTAIPKEIPFGISMTEYLSNSQNLEAESWHRLGLLLSCYLAEIHDGKILMQGSKESGYGYLVTLPQSQLN
ncbi:MAG: GAF domain-containing sensor histidine kinase [Coleofasciculaceae cyanobacterium SM2_1_6]|nr:GAF domain-containing sensor histidine kinase [Coleofasciculaceae cyanobacterium SM2_1_6]